MLKYLVILLDDTSVPYCHYCNCGRKPKLIDFDNLSKAVTFGMKENLRIQFVYPDYELPGQYEEMIDSIDHVNIKPATIAGKDDIAVGKLADLSVVQASNIVLTTTFDGLSDNVEKITDILYKKERLNLILTDIAAISDNEIEIYRDFLNQLVNEILRHNKNGERLPQLNILTDRLYLSGMNNCNAGVETITVAPDAKFYICPAFYYGDKSDCGTLSEGLNIKNRQLYRLDHAPICRKCDAWQCHRCVWLNKEKTLEVNTPGHIQCVISHIERNASRELLSGLRETETFTSESEIPEISYLDPINEII